MRFPAPAIPEISITKSRDATMCSSALRCSSFDASNAESPPIGSQVRQCAKDHYPRPYIRTFWQIRNCLEFLQLVNALTPEGEEVQVDLVTQSDRELCVQQDENLNHLVETMGGSKVTFSFDYDGRPTFHARSIQTDTGWKISVDRGLDIFQRYDMNALSLAAADQTERLTKGCEITYLLE